MSKRLLIASATSLLGVVLCGSAPATAQCTTPDAFEPNDDCASATVVLPGLHADLTAQGPAAPGGTDLDFFRVSLAPGESLEVTAYFQSHDTRDLDLYLYDPLVAGCGDRSAALASSTSSSDGERVHYTNAGATPQDLIIEVGPKTGADVICQTYDLDVQVGPDRCATGAAADVTFEDNDDCASAAVLAGSGTWTDLFVSETDVDFYEVSLQPGEQLYAAIDYVAFDGQLGLRLYDDPTCTNDVRSSNSGGHNGVSWENSTAAVVNMTLEVYVRSGQRCNDYALSLSVGPEPCSTPIEDSFGSIATCVSAATVAPGTYSDLYVGGPTRDCFRIVVPANELLTVDITYPRHINGDLGMGLYEANSCNSSVDYDYYGGSNTVSSSESSSVPREYWVKVFAMSASECNRYELTVTTTPDPCASAVEDAFEPNDSCSAPALTTPWVYTDLLCSDSSPDYYELVLQPTEQLEVMLSYPRSDGQQLKMLIQDVGCGSTLDYGGSSDGATAVWSNNGAVPVSVIVSVELQAISGTNCAPYDLILEVGLDPCLTSPDDTFAGNDDCATAAIINQGLHEGLFVHKTTPDYFILNIDLGDTLVLNLDYDSTSADVRLRLYQPVPVNGGACGDGSSYEASGFGSSGSKTLTWQNTLESGDYVIEIEVGPWSDPECTTYSLSIDGAGAPLALPLCFGDGSAEAGLGQVGCPCANLSATGAGEGCLNSLGQGAVLRAAGSNSVAADNLAFIVEQAIPGQPSLVLQGSAVVAFPFKDGILCTGNPTERIQVIQLDGSGSGTTTASVVTQGEIPGPGPTRYYQAWYRDPRLSACGSGSNLTQALQISWN